MKLYKTNDFFNLGWIKWLDTKGKTHQEPGNNQVLLPRYYISLEYTKVNNYNKFTYFDGHSVKKFTDIDVALDFIEDRNQVILENREQVIKEFNTYMNKKEK